MACYAAGVLLAAFAALVALPLQAQAQTAVWSGMLTVRDLGSSTLGCSNFVATSFCSSRLSEDDFTHDSTDYAIDFIFLRSTGSLEIDFDTDLTTATQGLTLNVDGTAFAFEDADTKTAQFRRWDSSELSWSAGDSVSLTLTESADAPDPPTDLTANAKGETQIDLSWTAPTSNSGVAISGYKIEVSANGTTTWSDLAADTASTDTTYSHTGLAAGNTRHYRVSAINSVDTGDASGVDGATTAAANVLVSNTGRSVDPAIAAGVSIGDQDKTHSQGFDTGPNPGGYSLASVGVYVTRPSLEAGEAFTVHIYTAASNGTLDTLQHTLTSPASYTDNAVSTFTAPAGATLDASTDYLVVFEGTGDVAPDFVLGVIASNGQDGGTRVGWAIENARRFNGTTNSNGESFQISVNGTAIPTPMPSNSGLVPTGLVLGDTFRLLFLSSTTRDASANGIGAYNTFVQERAAAGHTAIQAYEAGFRAVGCTSSTDARVNTRTLHTTSDQGVPIYWLNGAKAADDYADFYDGDWDEEAADKNESGTDGPDTSNTDNYPWTGCDHDGTEKSFSALGASAPGIGAPNVSDSGDGPLGSTMSAFASGSRPFYGLSELFQVAAAVAPNTAPTFPSTTANRSVAENTAAGQNVGAVLTATDSDGDTLTYTLEGTDAASFDLVTTADPATQIRTKTGLTYNHEAQSTYTVVVKADDTKGGTATVTVTITVTDVNEPPAQPAAPSVSATSGSTTSLDVSWTAPANTGPPIDNYDLQYQKTTESNWTNGPQNRTGTSAAIGSLDAGTAYRVQVRATNVEGDGGWSPAGTGTTTATGNTAATGNPEISGTAQVGMTLEAAPGNIDDADGLTAVSYSYRWRRAEVDIPGATSSNYTLTSADYGQEIKVWADFTDDGGTAERRISVATLPVAPAAAACPSDAATVWCTTLTAGHFLDEDEGDVTVIATGYEARPGREAYGSLGGAAFRHLGVDYTVTLLGAGNTQDLNFGTTPHLPADGAGLTVHVQTYGGELDAPLAEGVFQSGPQYWSFQGKVNHGPSTPLSDVPLLRSHYIRDALISEPPDLGTEVAVRLSYASTVLPGQTAVTFGASSYTASEGAGDDSADAVAPGRRHAGGLLGRAAERDVPGRAGAAHVHGHGDRRLGRRRRRERADRLRDAPGRVRGRRPPDGDSGAGRQRRPGDRGVLRRRRRPDGGRGQRHEGARVPERADADDGDDPADEDAPGRGHGGGLLGRARERDVPVRAEAARVHAAHGGRRRQRRQRVAADRLRAAPGGDPRQHGQPPPADPDGAPRGRRRRGPLERVVRGRSLHGRRGRRRRAGVDPPGRAGGGHTARRAADAALRRRRHGRGPRIDPGGGEVRRGRADQDDHGDGDRRLGRRRRRERGAVVRESPQRPGFDRRRADHGDGGAGGQRRGRAGDGGVRGGDLHGDGRRFRRDGARGTGHGARPLGDSAADEGQWRRRHGGGLLRHSGDRDVRSQPDGADVHRDRDQRLGRRRHAAQDLGAAAAEWVALPE